MLVALAHLHALVQQRNVGRSSHGERGQTLLGPCPRQMALPSLTPFPLSCVLKCPS